MADEIDFANDLTDVVSCNQSQITDRAPYRGLKTCVECGDFIQARKKLGFKLCVPCAEESERHKDLFADFTFYIKKFLAC